MTLSPDAPLELVDEVIVAGAPGRHRHSSSFVALPDGDLLVWYTEAIGDYPTRNGVLLQARSTDGGRTWEPPVAIYAVPDWTAMGLAGLRLAGAPGPTWAIHSASSPGCWRSTGPAPRSGPPTAGSSPAACYRTPRTSGTPGRS